MPAATPPDEGEIEINLQKVKKGETWNSALAGHESLDPFTKGEVQKKMMLERFQEENPGFDFSGAYTMVNLGLLSAEAGGWALLMSSTFWVAACLLLVRPPAGRRFKGACV